VLAPRDRPKPREGSVEQRIDQDRVGHREEAIGADRIDDGRDSDNRIGRIEITADQKPGDPQAEAAPAKAPFVEIREVAALPMRRNEAKNGDQKEIPDENTRRRPIQMIDHRFSPQ
jgi:hypothetical protein